MDSAVLELDCVDVSGQKNVHVSLYPDDLDATVGEITHQVVMDMSLPLEDSAGRPVAYTPHLAREQRHLLASECIGEVLESGDQLTLQPTINAG